MSPAKQGVFQLLKEVIFRKLLVSYNSPQLYQQGMLKHNQSILLDGKVADLV